MSAAAGEGPVLFGNTLSRIGIAILESPFADVSICYRYPSIADNRGHPFCYRLPNTAFRRNVGSAGPPSFDLEVPEAAPVTEYSPRSIQ